MALALSLRKRVNLVTRGQTMMWLEDEDNFRTLLATKEQPSVLWVTAPTGRPHIGYLVPLAKFGDFIKAGLEITVCYAGVCASLMDYSLSTEVVAHRRRYYHFLFTAILQSLGLDLSKISFVDEDAYCYDRGFVHDFLRTCARMTRQDAKETASQVTETRMLGPLLCSVYQSLAEQYVDCDIQFGGEDQRAHFLHAVTYLPQLGYKPREHLMNVTAKGLSGKKMSSSDPADTKIEFLDDPDTVRKKVDRLACAPGDRNSPVLLLLRDVLVPIHAQRLESLRDRNIPWADRSQDSLGPFLSRRAPEGTVLSIFTGDDVGWRHYMSFTDVENAFAGGEIGPESLKKAVADGLNHLLAPIRASYCWNEEWQGTERLAYPT